MSDGNKNRNLQVFELLYFMLLKHYQLMLKPKHRTDIIEQVKHHTIEIIDSECIGLCISLFNWARFRTVEGDIKIHPCRDDTLQMPDMVNITEEAIHKCKRFDQKVFKKDRIIVVDRGYFDFSVMLAHIKVQNIFVT